MAHNAAIATAGEPILSNHVTHPVPSDIHPKIVTKDATINSSAQTALKDSPILKPVR